MYQGQECRLKDAKGVHYLAALMHNPGREFHAARSAPAHRSAARHDGGRRAPQPRAPCAARSRCESAGRRAGARLPIKAGLQDVQAELEEADRQHDLGRLATLHAEQTFLTEELTAAYGFRRQARKAATVTTRSARMSQTVFVLPCSGYAQLTPPHGSTCGAPSRPAPFVPIPQSVTSRGRGRHPKVSEQSNCPARPIQGDKPDSLFPSSFFPVDSCRMSKLRTSARSTSAVNRGPKRPSQRVSKLLATMHQLGCPNL